LDRNEQEVGVPMRTEPPAPTSPARTASDRLHVLLCHAGAAGDLPTLEEVVAHALESLGTVLGAGRGAIALAGSTGALTVAGSWGLSPQSLAAIEALPPDAPDPAALLAALATDGVEDVAVLPLLADPPRGASQGAGYGEGAPQGDGEAPQGAVSEEAVVGLMVACYDAPQVCDEDDRRMAEILATQVAADVSRLRSGVVDRLSDAQLGAVLDAMGEGIIARGADGRLLWANQEAARVLGMSSVEELLATPIDEVSAPFEVFDAAGRPVTSESFPGRRALGSDAPVETIFRYRNRITGDERWVALRAQELLDGRQEPLGSVTVFRDITVRQRALLAREESEQRFGFLAALGPQLLDASLDYRGVLKRVAELLVPSLGDYCAIREVSEDGAVRRLALCHADPAKAELVSKIESYPLRGQEMLSRTLREGRSVLVRDVTEEHVRAAATDEEHYALLQELDIRSVMMVPVRARERTVGLILLVSAESGRRYGPDDTLLVEDVAHRAGLAIDNARLFEEERQARSLAEQTRSEMALLLDVSQVLSSSLNYEEGLDRLARVASSSLCDLCLIDLLDPEDGSIRRVAAQAANVERQPLADLLRGKYPLDPTGQHPAVRAMQTGKPEWAPEMEEGCIAAATRDAEHRRVTEALGFRSYISVPLAARGRTLGALTLIATTDSGRRYGPHDVALADDLARRAALALDNARLYQETEIQKALLSSQAEAAIEGVLVVSSDGAIISFNSQLAEMWSIPEDILAGRDADALLEWVTRLVEDPDGFAARVHDLRAHRAESSRDEIRLVDGRVFDRWSAPLAGEDGIYRGRAWYFRDVSDLKQAQEERSRLYEAELEARLEADRGRTRLAFLLEASTLLTGAMDVEAALSGLAELVVGSLADCCAIDLVSGDGSIVRAASASKQGVEMGGALVAAGVIRSRRPLLVPEVAQSPPDLLQAFMGSRILSYVGIPLVARSRMVGCLSLAQVGAGVRRYGPDDLALAQDLGQRVALALDRSRLFEAQRHIAMTLQASLLPPGLPEIPGVEIAARYRPASGTSDVGGDFYDVFGVGEGAWALAIGDISGKGVEAASLTALARYTVRAAAREHRKPREILLRLNEAVMDERPSSRFLTIAFGRLRWRASGLRLTVACGGHPPPLLLRGGGTVERAARPGTLIGFLPSPELPEKVNELNVGDVALFFTDGLTDVRGPSGTFGEERLVALLQQCEGLGAEEIASTLENAVVAFQAGEPRDDLAMLVLRVVGPVP
jgi:PAS domain S-box-containing protein